MAQGKLGYLIYNFFLFLAALFFIPYFVVRNLVLRRPVFPYFSGLSKADRQKLIGQPVIWMQAVSVGETVVANCILTQIRKLLPEHQIVFTTTTPTGQDMARKLLGDSALITYFPFDFPIFVKHFVRVLQPNLFIMVETEIWPNAIRYSKAAGAKVVMVNGRISDRSFTKYYKLRSFLGKIFTSVDLFAMQSADDANRIGKLGASLNRIMVPGNAKFDCDYPTFSAKQLNDFLVQYRWSDQTKIFTAASTHHGEEEIIIDAFKKLLAKEPYQLILAPRHPNRGEEVAAILREANLSFVRRSSGKTDERPQVLLLDTFGEFGLAYAVADVIFVGGSLVKVGGHNVLEAAAQTKPVIYGPYMHNFRESKRLLEEADAGFIVHNAEELVQTIDHILADSTIYQQRAENAKAAVLSNQGAAANTARLVAEVLEKAF